jgi:hypothetical protein
VKPVRKLTRIRGEARLETVRRGTGSEHTGVILESPEGKRWILVRIGGNPFDDPETRNLSGRTIEVEGYCVGAELRYVAVRDVSH